MLPRKSVLLVALIFGLFYMGEALPLTIDDTTPPTFSNPTITDGIEPSCDIGNLPCTFSLQVNDNMALQPRGQYIFSSNVSGVWVNETAVNFTATPQNATYTKTMPNWGSIGWKFYAKDNRSNWAVSDTYIVTITNLRNVKFYVYDSRTNETLDGWDITSYSWDQPYWIENDLPTPTTHGFSFNGTVYQRRFNYTITIWGFRPWKGIFPLSNTEARDKPSDCIKMGCTWNESESKCYGTPYPCSHHEPTVWYEADCVEAGCTPNAKHCRWWQHPQFCPGCYFTDLWGTGDCRGPTTGNWCDQYNGRYPGPHYSGTLLEYDNVIQHSPWPCGDPYNSQNIYLYKPTMNFTVYGMNYYVNISWKGTGWGGAPLTMLLHPVPAINSIEMDTWGYGLYCEDGCQVSDYENWYPAKSNKPHPIAIVESGGCDITTKVKNAQNATEGMYPGYKIKGLIIYNNETEGNFLGTLTQASEIPVVTVSKKEGMYLRSISDGHDGLHAIKIEWNYGLEYISEFNVDCRINDTWSWHYTHIPTHPLDNFFSYRLPYNSTVKCNFTNPNYYTKTITFLPTKDMETEVYLTKPDITFWVYDDGAIPESPFFGQPLNDWNVSCDTYWNATHQNTPTSHLFYYPRNYYCNFNRANYTPTSVGFKADADKNVTVFMKFIPPVPPLVVCKVIKCPGIDPEHKLSSLAYNTVCNFMNWSMCNPLFLGMIFVIAFVLIIVFATKWEVRYKWWD